MARTQSHSAYCNVGRATPVRWAHSIQHSLSTRSHCHQGITFCIHMNRCTSFNTYIAMNILKTRPSLDSVLLGIGISTPGRGAHLNPCLHSSLWQVTEWISLNCTDCFASDLNIHSHDSSTGILSGVDENHSHHLQGAFWILTLTLHIRCPSR